jgi:hypothetical protein
VPVAVAEGGSTTPGEVTHDQQPQKQQVTVAGQPQVPVAVGPQQVSLANIMTFMQSMQSSFNQRFEQLENAQSGPTKRKRVDSETEDDEANSVDKKKKIV